MSFGIQAIVLAAGRGSRIPELVSSQPKCLLPIGNRPMIYYPLHALESCKFSVVTIVINEGQKEAVSEAIYNHFDTRTMTNRIGWFLLPNKDEDYGTADTLRLMHEQKQISSDFLVISCDTLTNYPLYQLVSSYHIRDAAITCLLSSSNIISDGSTPGKKGKPVLEKDLIGIDYQNNDRLVFFNSELVFDEDIPFSISMLKRCPQFIIHNNFLDTHIYIIKKWVLDYLAEKRQFKSIKANLIPRLVREQFKSNVIQNKTTYDSEVENKYKVDLLDYVEEDEIYKAIENLDNFNLSHVTVNPDTKEKKKVYPDSAVKCYAVIQRDGISLRANTVTGYFEANKRLRAIFPNLPVKDKTSVPSTPTTPNVGPPVKVQIGADCLVSPSSRIGDKTSIKRSCIGDHCLIGEKAKIANCVIMNHVTVEAGCNIQGSIICNNAVICSSAEIKDCIVAANHKIATYGQFSNEVIPPTFVDASDDL
ncbi:translation initiation factor eIF-2B subunit gamma [Tetranychus urticae]|uniref:Translation initiation factor eIF2B subunit gamma n=1 Tax=Tetranychus urticae TaxID=32264 RepID=T1JS53_TETUR|nr:translation initiation factor eIF-2B subunit gamma [Tetranychus urticae]